MFHYNEFPSKDLILISSVIEWCALTCSEVHVIGDATCWSSISNVPSWRTFGIVSFHYSWYAFLTLLCICSCPLGWRTDDQMVLYWWNGNMNLFSIGIWIVFIDLYVVMPFCFWVFVFLGCSIYIWSLYKDYISLI